MTRDSAVVFADLTREVIRAAAFLVLCASIVGLCAGLS
jgi:hypothetical protein